MSARKIQDILPPKKRKSFFEGRALSAGAGATKEHKVDGVPRKTLSFFHTRPKSEPLFVEGRNKKKRGAFFFGASIAVLLILGIFFISSEKTTLLITPKQISVSIEETFTAYIAGSDAKNDALFFEVLTISDTETKTIPATNVKQLDRRSSGQIIVYNNFSSQSQRLIKNTRFETSDGLTFRIQESVVVPGQKKVGGETIPGSLEITVYADEPGEKYNIGLRDLTIPGFKGTPRYEEFYARSKTEMTGGFSGFVKTVSEDLLEETEAELRSRAENKLLTLAAGEVPDGFVLYPDAVFIDFPREKIPPEQADIDKDSVDVTTKAVFYGILFNKDALGDVIAHKLFSDLSQNEHVFLRAIEDLDFALEHKEDIDPTSVQMITFTLKGESKFEWQFDEIELKEALLGKESDELKSILAKFPGIVRAEVSIRPRWKSTFPAIPKDIIVKKVLEE